MKKKKKIVKKQWTNASMNLNSTYRKYQQKKENVWNIYSQPHSYLDLQSFSIYDIQKYSLF